MSEAINGMWGEENDDELKRHIKFRNVLLADEELRNEYIKIKPVEKNQVI